MPSLLLTELDEIADMVSLRASTTEIANTIFISTQGYARHTPRIKIAVDPSDALTARSKTVSMTIHDCRIIGSGLAPHIAVQAKQFIMRNRETLLDYWDGEIDTKQLIERLM
jgi:hypothetical protein